jgi:serine/threonine protein kinase
MLATGTVLQNRYEIIKPIGQGGMGAVYLARDQRLGNTVALKETFFLDTILLAAFEREAKLLAGLRHAALPKVIDHFADTNGQFLVMEYIPGEDLQELLQEGSSPPQIDEVLQWADQLLDALAYLHSQQPPVIHRDIKPQNLKLTSRNQIVLLDFGLAKGTAIEMTGTGSNSSIFGYTPSYAPLEQAQGSGTDPQSDIYSLAATLYHLITGRKPVDSVARATCILNGHPDPLAAAIEVNPRVTADLNAVIMRSMALKKDDRPSNADEMRRMLRDSARPIGDNLAANVHPLPPRAEVNRANNPANDSSTQLFASAPTNPAAGPYASRVSATAERRPIGAQVAEKSLNRARPATAAARRRSTAVEIPDHRASSLSKVIVAGIGLILAVVITLYAFKPDLKGGATNVTPVTSQKSEPAAGSEQSGAGAKTVVEAPGGANLKIDPFAPIEQPAKEANASGRDDKAEAKSVEAAQATEQGESRQGIERTNTARQPEAAEAVQSQPAPRRPEEEVREEPMRPMPPPPDLHRPPPFPPPPPPGMPPPGRRRP